MKLIEKLRFKLLELRFFQSKSQIKKEIECALNSKIIMRPFVAGKGYTTKYIVFVAGKKYFLKVANRRAERRIKKIDKNSRHTYLQRLQREHYVLKTLSSINLSPKPILLGKSYLLMEFIAGPLLSDVFSSQNTSKKEIFYYLNQSFESIKKIHAKKIICPDLTPSNIIIKDSKFYFIDFEIYRENESTTVQISSALEKYICKLENYNFSNTSRYKKLVRTFINSYGRAIQTSFEKYVST